MAEQLEPVQRLVALKIIRIGMDTREFIARSEQERLLFSHLRIQEENPRPPVTTRPQFCSKALNELI